LPFSTLLGGANRQPSFCICSLIGCIYQEDASDWL
jgi:hypothetical protein